jgi:hypothetical protein
MNSEYTTELVWSCVAVLWKIPSKGFRLELVVSAMLRLSKGGADGKRRSGSFQAAV